MVKSRVSSSILFAVVALAASGAASAASFYHPNGTERGVTLHPEDITSQKTRAQVYQELMEAKRNGFMNVPDNRYPNFEVASNGPGKTRAEVQQELRNMTAADKQRWYQLYGRN